VSSNITYNRQFFSHKDWIDFVDSIQAGGSNGVNGRMHAIEQEFDAISGVVGQLNAGLGAFQPVGAAGAVAYTGGNVGIGASFVAATPPTYQLEVNLDVNSGAAQRVRFGNVVCCNGGAGPFGGYAVFSHMSHASDTDYALRQGPNGDVDLNAVAGRPIRFRQNGNTTRFAVSSNGNVIVGSDTDLGFPQAGPAILQVNGDAFKATTSGTWLNNSDARLKEDVRDLETGLAQLLRVRPVRFRYNGRAGTTAGQEGVGVLGQEIEEIFPETIRRVPSGVAADPDLEGLRIFDSGPLTFVLINAVKELAAKVERLEQALAQTSRSSGPAERPTRRGRRRAHRSDEPPTTASRQFSPSKERETTTGELP